MAEKSVDEKETSPKPSQERLAESHIIEILKSRGPVCLVGAVLRDVGADITLPRGGLICHMPSPKKGVLYRVCDILGIAPWNPLYARTTLKVEYLDEREVFSYTYLDERFHDEFVGMQEDFFQ